MRQGFSRVWNIYFYFHLFLSKRNTMFTDNSFVDYYKTPREDGDFKMQTIIKKDENYTF